MKHRLSQIMPECEIEAKNMMYNRENDNELFGRAKTKIVFHNDNDSDSDNDNDINGVQNNWSDRVNQQSTAEDIYNNNDDDESHSNPATSFDFVIDAIDNIATKVDLLYSCHRRSIPVLSCGGAGAKVDPTRMKIVDISESNADRLCR